MWRSILQNTLINKFKTNTDIRKIVTNSGWLLFDRLCRMGLGLLVGAWVARYLGPEQYGELAYILAYIAFFQAVVVLGLDNIVVREIAKKPAQAGTIIGTTLSLRLLSGFILWFIAVCNMAFFNGVTDKTTVLTALCGGSLIFQAADVIDLWFQSQSQSKKTVIVKLLSYLIANGMKVYLILSHSSIVYFAAIATIECLLSSLGLIFAYKKYTIKGGISYSLNMVKELLSESWPYIFSSLSIVIYMRIDQMMIKQILSEKELGIYAAITPLAMMWTFIPMTLSTSIAPFLARKRMISDIEYWQSLKKIFRLYAALGWGVCLFVASTSPLIVPLLFGKDYIQSVPILQILVFTNLFINMGLAQSLWILNEQKSKLALYRTLFGACICVVMNLFLIPTIGLYGAAISAIMAQLGSTILSNLLINRQILKIQIRSLFLFK